MSEQIEPRTTDYLLAQVCRLHHSRAHVLLDEIGLYRGQPPLLDVLYGREGLTHSELAAHLRVAPATMTKMLQRMEKAGFVVRRADEVDQRVSRVFLTDVGRAIRSEMQAVLDKLARETFAGFSADEAVLVRQLLLKIHENLVSAGE